MIRRQKPLRHPRLIVKAVEACFACDLDEVAVAFVVFGENDEVVVGIAVRGGAAVRSRMAFFKPEGRGFNALAI